MSFVDICPLCSHYSRLVWGLKRTPPLCIDCAIDPTWINPQDNWDEDSVMLWQGNEIGPARVIVWHSKYSVIEQTTGDRELIIMYWTGEKYQLPRGNRLAFHTQMPYNSMPNVITPTEVNKMAYTTMEQGTSTQMDIVKPSTSRVGTLDGMFQVELSKLKREENQGNESLAYTTRTTNRPEILSPLLKHLLIDSPQATVPEMVTPKGNVWPQEKNIFDRSYNVATQEKQNHNNVEGPSIQNVGQKFTEKTYTTTKRSEIDAEKPSTFTEAEKVTSVNTFSGKLLEFDTFKDFQDAMNTIMGPNKDSSLKSEARMHRKSTMANMENDGGPFKEEHHPKIANNLKFASQDNISNLAPKETTKETADEMFSQSEQCLGDNYQTKIPAKVEESKPRIQKSSIKPLTRMQKKQKTRIESDVGDLTLDRKVSINKNFPNTSGAMVLEQAIEDTGVASKQGQAKERKELKVKLFDIGTLKNGTYRLDVLGMAFKKQKPSNPNQSKPKMPKTEMEHSADDIEKMCKVTVHLEKQPMIKPVEKEKESELVLRNGRTLKKTEQNSKEAEIPSKKAPEKKCKTPNQEIHLQIVARNEVIQNQERLKRNCKKRGKSHKEVQPLGIPQAPFTKSVAADLPNFATARNEEKVKKENLMQTVMNSKDISTQTEGLAYRNSQKRIDYNRNFEKSKTRKTILLSEIPQTTKRLRKIPFKRAESTKRLPGELTNFAISQNAEKAHKEIMGKAYTTMVSEVESSMQDKTKMLKIQNIERADCRAISKTQNAMLLSDRPQAMSSNSSLTAMSKNNAESPIKDGSRQRMMIAKQEIATQNEGYGQKEKLQIRGQSSTISRQEGQTGQDPQICEKNLKKYQDVREMTCMKSPSDKMPHIATASQAKEQLEDGELQESVSFEIQIHVFGKDSQRINPNSRDVNICHWSQLWFETTPRKLNCDQMQKRDGVRSENWQRITSILAGSANPNLIFMSWRSYVGKDMMSKSVHVVSFRLRNDTLAISVYAHALGLWAYIKEISLSGSYCREKYFIANVKHEMTDDFKIGLQDDRGERKGCKRPWEDGQRNDQATYKRAREQKSNAFRREWHSSQNGRSVKASP